MFSSYYMDARGHVYPNQINQDDVAVVVISPEDREQVERLAAGYEHDTDPGEVAIEQMQNALRSLIAPPKPEEPTGLGAVVEDEDGRLWANLTDPNCATHSDPWMSVHDAERWASYSDISAVRVLSEGVRR